MYNSNESDGNLIERVKNGDQEAFNPLVERYKLPLYKVMYRMVYNRDDAEDLVEEAFIRAFHAIQRFEKGKLFYAWLCRIAVNNAINFLKKEKRGRVQSIESMEHTLAAKHGDPVSMTRNKLLQEQLAAALAKLSGDERAIITLKVEEDFSYDEIATILKIPRGTVMSRLSRARQKLRSLLETK